ncbi:baseplate tail tube cap [Synechococcus phage S-RSM4]|uniref:Baseplate tail tube cap n=1 Tax=Synechococcus phage S-RSM4 TaxID=555387 RepID=C7BVK2_9CAUD|nr:baseplate tail tube cap [Synechococcus phage S-RSM4]CAR63431.1 baseplate tail tube cap [Synechococcus phage S-RSM4]
MPPENALAEVMIGDGLRQEEAKNTIEGTKIRLKGLDPVSRPEDSTSYRYPRDDIAPDADYVMFNFYDYVPPYSSGVDITKDYNQSSSYTKASSKFKTILLYMPEDISTGFRAGWAGKSMANTTAGALRSLGKEGLGGKAAEAGKATVEALERTGALLGAAAVQNIAKAVSGDSLSYDDIFGAIGGSVLNPNTELLFSNIDLRNFTLNFKLVPRNQDESIDIRGIVKSFKKAMLPSKDPGEVFDFNTDGNNRGVQLGFISVPKLCRVSFMKGSKEHPYLPRFKMCAITNMDVNYTPDGAYATYKDGQPVAIGLSLSFQETKICFAEDIGDPLKGGYQ